MSQVPTTAPAGVAVVADGWWNLADAAGYFPEDLPDDWRPVYFANDYQGVYVPYADWQRMPMDALAHWHRDVHEGFAFYLEMPALECPALEWPASAAPEQLAAAAAGLGHKLAACVRWGADTDAPGELWCPPRDSRAMCRIGQALRCPSTAQRDLRAAARWLQAVAGAAPTTLVVLSKPTSGQLADWQQLPALLGLAVPAIVAPV
jgi:hypothetical protein